jgi:hypothetical protein
MAREKTDGRQENFAKILCQCGKQYTKNGEIEKIMQF